MSRFSIPDFAASADPWQYLLKTGILQPNTVVSHEELVDLRESLNAFDDLHLAFALSIAEAKRPEMFGQAAAMLLGHPSMSVRVNAYRVLHAIPSEFISRELRTAVETGLER